MAPLPQHDGGVTCVGRPKSACLSEQMLTTVRRATPFLLRTRLTKRQASGDKMDDVETGKRNAAYAAVDELVTVSCDGPSDSVVCL